MQGRAPVREAGGRASSSSLSTSSGLGPRLSAQSGRWWCPHWEDTPAGPGGTATCRGAVCTGAARPALSPPTAHLDAQPWAKPHAGGSPAALPCFSDLPPKGHLKHISPQRPRVCVCVCDETVPRWRLRGQVLLHPSPASGLYGGDSHP